MTDKLEAVPFLPTPEALRAALELEMPDPVIESQGYVFTPTMVLAQDPLGKVYQMLDDHNGHRLWRKLGWLDEMVQRMGGEIIP